MKILCIEDAIEFQLLIQVSLGEENVTQCGTLADARLKLQKDVFDLVLLDLGLPDGDGMNFYEEMKSMPQHINTPVFFLTGKSDTVNKVLAFSMGAEDYIVKPFDPLELKARVDAKIKKKSKSSSSTVYGNIKIDFIRGDVQILVQKKWQSIKLTSTEHRILTFFVENDGKVLSRKQIVDFVWPENIHILDRNVDSHISSLRKKLKDYSFYIKAVHGSGYKMTKETKEKKRSAKSAA